MSIPPEITVAIMSLAGTCIGSIAGIMTSNKLTVYRIEQLEKKVDKHNSVVERVGVLETEVRDMKGDIAELKEK